MKQWIKNIKDRYSSNYQKEKQKQARWNVLLGNQAKGTESLFNQQAMAWFVVAITFFLQCISLATTYEGSQVYFGGIDLPLGLSAAFLFAFSIQSIVFTMSHTLKNSMKKGIVVVLILATLCSTYFSYVGIYNYIHSPLQYLEERYNQVYGTMTDQYNMMRDEINTAMKEDVFELTTTLNEQMTRLQKQVEENENLKKQLDNIKIDTGNIKPNTSGMVKPNINHYQDNLDQYYADMAKYHAAVNTVISDTTAKDQELKNTLYNQQVESVLGGKSKEVFLKESIEVQTQKEQLQRTIESMYGLVVEVEDEAVEGTLALEDKLYKIQNYILDYIVGGQGDVEKVNTLLTQLTTQASMDDSEGKMEGFDKQLSKFVLVSQKDKVLIQSLEEIYQQMGVTNAREVDPMQLYSLMQAELNKGAHILNQLQENTVDLQADNYVLHNLYVLPIKNLSESSMAWFCLMFAVLVDGLTLMFALMERKKRSILSLNKNKQITRQSEDGVERLLVTTLLNQDNQKGDHQVQSISMKLERFLGHFELLPEAMGEGYSMWCHLKKLRDYQMFVAVICQFNLATIVKGEDIPEVNRGDIELDEEYVLLKTKFVLWASEKVAFWNEEVAMNGQLEYKEF